MRKKKLERRMGNEEVFKFPHSVIKWAGPAKETTEDMEEGGANGRQKRTCLHNLGFEIHANLEFVGKHKVI